MANFWKQLKRPFTVLAPMEDVTDYVFREIIAETAKPDVLFTEFTNTDGLFSKGREKTILNFDYSEKQRPIVAQIWGPNPETYFKAAKLVRELKFDGIDINMGCPVRAVMKKKSGAGLIGEQELAKVLIKAVKAGAGDIPVSVKTRIGIKTIVTEEWISFLLNQNIDALTIHGRTSDEQSKVPAHWDEIAKAVKIRNKIAPDTIIIGNGDIRDYGEVCEKYESHTVDGVMIGRGIFNNLWALSPEHYNRPHDKNTNLYIYLMHIAMFEKKWGKTKNFETLKKFSKMYINGFNGASEMRQQIAGCKSYNDIISVLKNFLNPV